MQTPPNEPGEAIGVIQANVDIEAVIIRADGTIENLGVVASSADGTASVEQGEG